MFYRETCCDISNVLEKDHLLTRELSSAHEKIYLMTNDLCEIAKFTFLKMQLFDRMISS